MPNTTDKTFNYWKSDKEPPVLLQSEASECGLACVAMIANYYGHEVSLLTLRKRFSVSLKGINLADIVNIVQELDMVGRPLQLELDEIGELKCPCILHWNLNHFVVLVKVTSNKAVIIDPGIGRTVIDLSELSNHFTGIALEVAKSKSFRPKKEKESIDIYALFKDIRGLKTNIITLLLIALAIEILSLFNPFLMQWSIDKVIPFNDGNLLTLLILGFFVVLLVNSVLEFCQSWIVLYFSNNLKIEVETSIFSKLINLPLDYFQKRHLGDIVSRFGSIHNIQAVFTTQFITAILDGVFAILTLVLMALYSPILTVIVICTVAIYVLIRWMYYKPLKVVSQEKLVFEAEKETYFLETVRGIRAIQFFNQQTQRMNQWLNAYIKEVNTDVKTGKLLIIFSLMNGLIFGLENLLVIWIGIGKIVDGVFTVGVFIAFIAYKEQFKTKISSLIDNFIKYKLLDVDKSRLADIVLTEDNRTFKDGIFDIDQMQDNSVQISNVSFKYSENDRLVLQNIDITIDSNEFVVITGSSGRGKSTLMNLIAGINVPTEGDILMGGKSILRHKLTNDLISMVSQDDTLYAGSVLENICFFDYYADVAWIEECAKMACIHDEIVNMPMGYETLVGDMGTVLSGGQKQRIYIARSLYFKPKILLLDEATSHLDTENEYKINSILKEIPITRIVIAHREETIKSADRIISL